MQWVDEMRRRGFTDEHIRRMIQLNKLEVLGLARREPLRDGSAELIFPEPNHPDVRAFIDSGPCSCCGEPEAFMEH
jgi:hypothetical protein